MTGLHVESDWGWLLGRLGFAKVAEWDHGFSWEAGGSCLTLTTSPNSYRAAMTAAVRG